MPTTVRPFRSSDQAQVIKLVLAIQQEEFGIPISAEEQPDLADVAAHYAVSGGNFWVAEEAGAVVGTVGLLSIGAGDLALRKMFVASDHRGMGVAAALLAACLDWAREAGFSRILLGTTDQFKAAHRFYEKAGFAQVPVAELPAHFPRMRLDTRFYSLILPAPVTDSDATGWSGVE
jgi:GNAT superfamily N-acetyltransferase